MKKLAILCALFLFQANLWSQEKAKPKNPETINLDGGRKIVRSYFDNSQLKTIHSYVGEKLDGISKIFYESGEVAFIDTYSYGEKSNRKAYDEKGKLMFETNYPVLRSQTAQDVWLNQAKSDPVIEQTRTPSTQYEAKSANMAVPEPQRGGSFSMHDYSVGDGTFSMDLKAGFSRFAGSNSGGLALTLSRFFTDYFFPGVTLGFNAATDYTDFTFGPSFRGVLNLRTRVLPYIGVTPGVFYVSIADFSKTAFFIGIQAGSAFIIVEHVGILLSFDYKRIFIGDGMNSFMIPLGLIVYF